MFPTAEPRHEDTTMAKWWWKADYVETCNCAHGCPCNFTQIPTDGTCKSMVAWDIHEGECDGVRLDGLRLGLVAAWPNAIHKGNGRCLIYIDERADASCVILLRTSFVSAGIARVVSARIRSCSATSSSLRQRLCQTRLNPPPNLRSPRLANSSARDPSRMWETTRIVGDA